MRPLHTIEVELVVQELVQTIVQYSPLRCPLEFSHYIDQNGEWAWLKMIDEPIGTLQDCLKRMH